MPLVEVDRDPPTDRVRNGPLDPRNRRLEHGIASRPAPEEQLERRALLGDEAEVGEEARLDLLAGPTRGRGCRREPAHQLPPDVVQELEEQCALGAEVLVENRFGDAGPLRDLVHRREREALLREDRERGVEELSPARGAWHPARSGARPGSGAGQGSGAGVGGRLGRGHGVGHQLAPRRPATAAARARALSGDDRTQARVPAGGRAVSLGGRAVSLRGRAGGGERGARRRRRARRGLRD